MRMESRCFDKLTMECTLLSSSLGLLMHESRLVFPNKTSLQRARLIAAEWENGISALNGEDMTGIRGTGGTFPTTTARFIWIKGALKTHARSSSDACMGLARARHHMLILALWLVVPVTFVMLIWTVLLVREMRWHNSTRACITNGTVHRQACRMGINVDMDHEFY
jgi:hypothetical protein